jgi:hypothetical protein
MKQAKDFSQPYSILRRHFERLPTARKFEAIRRGCRVVDVAEADTMTPPLSLSFSRSEWQSLPEARRIELTGEADLAIYSDEWADPVAQK